MYCPIQITLFDVVCILIVLGKEDMFLTLLKVRVSNCEWNAHDNLVEEAIEKEEVKIRGLVGKSDSLVTSLAGAFIINQSQRGLQPRTGKHQDNLT